MIKISIFLITLWTLSHEAYVSRIAALNRLRAPVAFRPGVMLQRPYPQRVIQTATRRAPYIVYRNTPNNHRFVVKHVSPTPIRNVYGPWKTTRIPVVLSSPTPAVFIRSASPSPVIHPDGAIHTIPAPNLSLSEKPIVVIDSSEQSRAQGQQQRTYEVTEKYSEQPYQSSPKIETPIGFSKASSVSAGDLQNIVRQNTALQVASEYTLPVHFSQPTIQLQQSSIVPQQFTFQGFHTIPSQQEIIHREPEHIIIPQNAFYPPDSMFMQNFQTQFLHQFPGAEFVPYTPETQTQYQTQATKSQTELFLLQNEEITKQTPSAFISNDGQKNLVQRETQESSFSIVPKGFSAKNVSENLIETEVTPSTQSNQYMENITSYVTPVETQAQTTTNKNIVETITEEVKTTPIFYAQIGQSVGNMIANGFFSAINDVRAAEEADMPKKEKKLENLDNNTTSSPSSTTTTTKTTTTSTASTTKPPTTTFTPMTVSTTTQSEVKHLTRKNNKTENKIKDLPEVGLGSPFEKPAASLNVAYTLLRANEKQPRVNQEGEIFAGQLVEAKISEDQEFNKEKASLLNRPPVKLFAVTEKRISDSTPKQTVVKAKIPPKSKLTFDDKTGEPVLRVYASYIDSPLQKEIITSKLTNMKRNKTATRKQDLNIDWKEDDVKSLEKTFTDFDDTQFGLKLRSRSDHHVPIFEDYEK